MTGLGVDWDNRPMEEMGMSEQVLTVRGVRRTFEAENADGWGLAWYPDRSVAVVKEALDWRESPYSKFLESYARLRSPIYIAHVRHRSTGVENQVHE